MCAASAVSIARAQGILSSGGNFAGKSFTGQECTSDLCCPRSCPQFVPGLERCKRHMLWQLVGLVFHASGRQLISVWCGSEPGLSLLGSASSVNVVMRRPSGTRDSHAFLCVGRAQRF